MHRREADRKLKRHRGTATRGAHRIAKQQRMAARRALRTLKPKLVYTYEVSGLFNCTGF